MPSEDYRLVEGAGSYRGRHRDRVARGVALLRALSDGTGLTAGLSKALASKRLLIHDRGRVLADLARAVADGAEVISDPLPRRSGRTVRAGGFGADRVAHAG